MPIIVVTREAAKMTTEELAKGNANVKTTETEKHYMMLIQIGRAHV